MTFTNIEHRVYTEIMLDQSSKTTLNDIRFLKNRKTSILLCLFNFYTRNQISRKCINKIKSAFIVAQYYVSQVEKLQNG